METKNMVLFSAYAKLPVGTVSSELYKVMALVFLVNVKTGQIVEVDCTLSTRLAERFVSRLLVDKNINNLEQLISIIQDHYQGAARNTLIAALRTIGDKYTCYSK